MLKIGISFPDWIWQVSIHPVNPVMPFVCWIKGLLTSRNLFFRKQQLNPDVLKHRALLRTLILNCIYVTTPTVKASILYLRTCRVARGVKLTQKSFLLCVLPKKCKTRVPHKQFTKSELCFSIPSLTPYLNGHIMSKSDSKFSAQKLKW